MATRASLLRAGWMTGCVSLVASTAHAVPQQSDCNGDGIPDFQQFGPYYAVWAPTSPSGSGQLEDDANWCPGGFGYQDLLIFEHDDQAGTGLVTFNAFWQAGGLWMRDGAWDLDGGETGCYLGDSTISNPLLRVNATARIEGQFSVEGNATVGDSFDDGMLTVDSGGLSCTGEVEVGTGSSGTLVLVNSYLTADCIIVGTTLEDVPNAQGVLLVDEQSNVEVANCLSIAHEAHVDGTVKGMVVGPTTLGARPAVLSGSGSIESLKGGLLNVAPTLRVDADGQPDDELEVEGQFAMVDPLTGAVGSIIIAPTLYSQTVEVPSIRAGSAVLGGTLIGAFQDPTYSNFPPTDIIVTEAGIEGNFEAIQSDGLPAGRTLRAVKSADGKRITLSTQTALPPPDMDGGPQVALLRVGLDNAVADFNNDGVLDVAVLLERDSSGKSAVRFFKTDVDGQDQAAQVELVGEAVHITAFRPSSSALPGVAITMAEGAVIILQNNGGWNFTAHAVELSATDEPAGIASGSFIETSSGAPGQLAVACTGSSKLRILGQGIDGQFGVIGSTTIPGARLVDRANLDGTGLDDVVVSEANGSAFWSLTNIGAGGGPPVRWPVPARVAGICASPLQGTSDAVVCTLESPADVQEPGPPNIAVCRPGSTALLRPPVLLSAGILASDIAAGDLDGDGLIDLAVVTTIGGVESIAFLSNTSDPDDPQSPLVFTQGGTMSGVYRPRFIELADVDGDGDAEVATLCAGNPNGSSLGPDWDEGLGSNGGGGGCTSGDIDCDGDVDGADLAALLGSWGPCTGCPADFNGDGSVGGSDLATLLGNWG